MGRPNTVTFTTSDDTLPLPNPEYLALHALAAQLAHMSAAAEYLDEFYRDSEEIRVLANNDGSVDLLMTKLQVLSRCVPVY